MVESGADRLCLLPTPPTDVQEAPTKPLKDLDFHNRGSGRSRRTGYMNPGTRQGKGQRNTFFLSGLSFDRCMFPCYHYHETLQPTLVSSRVHLQYQVQGHGQGEFSQVHLARHRLTGAEVAVKVLRLAVQNIPVLSEPYVLKRLEHPSVVRLFQVMATREKLYVVMELAAGEQLLRRIPRGGMLHEEARRVLRQVACAVAYCLKQGMAHRELKPENIMVDAAGHIKLIDFGLSARFRPGQKLHNFWGTLAYLAPEIVLRQEYEGPPADVWSLGVRLYFMLTGSRPFRAPTAQDVLMEIVQARFHVPSSVPAHARRLIRQILTVKPKKRPTVQQILQHPWLRQGEPCAPHPPSQALPQRPDNALLTVLFDLAFDPYHTWLSLAKRKFDAAMATYLLLKHQQGQGRSASEPALRTFPGPPEGPLPQEAQEPGLQGVRTASLPAVPLRCRPAGAPTLGSCLQLDSDLHLADPSAILYAWSRTDSSSASSQDTATPQGHGHTSAWKRVRRTIGACLRGLCCCLPRASSRVAPTPQRRSGPHRERRASQELES
ncbi:sperm motility kinase 2B-like [Sciurus carolinensis]|uniref:sperm motility kinase 2B-like n=1 Tax=Sciurus carolinensis TaxID=30640 RepID=UPI001FB37579|nr:sperm motility kinase 2B-like [Sciurus carolinensis]